MTDEDAQSELIRKAYPRVMKFLEEFRERHPDQWANRDAATWREIDKLMPPELRWEWMACKGEIAHGHFGDPERREIALEAVRKRARDALAQGDALSVSKRWLCEMALQWPGACLPGRGWAVDHSQVVAYLREQHPQGATADEVMAQAPDHIQRAVAAVPLADDWAELFGRPDKPLDG